MKHRHTLSLGEQVRAEIYRAKPWGYSDKPDELPDIVDLITNAGRVFLALRISGGDTVASAMAYMAVGTDATAAVIADTTLPGEISRLSSAVASATANNVYTNVATWGGFSNTVQSISIVEAGVFNHASSGQGTLYQRVTFAGVVLADSDLLKITLQTVVGSNTI